MNHAGSDNLQLLKLSKAQIKSLQEAMYHSTENNHLGELPVMILHHADDWIHGVYKNLRIGLNFT